MKKLLLSVAALILATILLSLDDINTIDEDFTQDSIVKVQKDFETDS